MGAPDEEKELWESPSQVSTQISETPSGTATPTRRAVLDPQVETELATLPGYAPPSYPPPPLPMPNSEMDIKAETCESLQDAPMSDHSLAVGVNDWRSQALLSLMLQKRHALQQSTMRHKLR